MPSLMGRQIRVVTMFIPDIGPVPLLSASGRPQVP
jgi:hypothetical protein